MKSINDGLVNSQMVRIESRRIVQIIQQELNGHLLGAK